MKSLQIGDFDSKTLRNAFACVPSGVAAVCALIDGQPCGLAASTFTSVSLDPPLVSICIQNSSTTWPRLLLAPRLGISMLGAEHDRACRALSSKDGDRFKDVSWLANESGAVFIDSAAAHFECSIFRQVEAGDHVIALLKIEALATDPEIEPLVFHGSRFRRFAASISERGV